MITSGTTSEEQGGLDMLSNRSGPLEVVDTKARSNAEVGLQGS